MVRICEDVEWAFLRSPRFSFLVFVFPSTPFLASGFQGCIRGNTSDNLRIMIGRWLTLLLIFWIWMPVQASQEHLDAGLRFREEHAKREGVTVLPSGLQYRILSEGDGRRPAASDRVAVYYSGSLINGREFDAADIIRPPAVFRVDGLIPGWIEALQLMTEGSVWEIVVPPHLAYGEKGSGTRIPPNATLVFELELVSVL